MTDSNSYSLWQFLFSNHPMLQLLGSLLVATFVFGLYNFIKNYLYLKKNTQKDSDFIESIVDDLHEGKIESALDLCHRSEFAEARVAEKALIRMGRPIADIISAIKQQEACEHIRLQQHIMWVSFASQSCLILGLLSAAVGYHYLADGHPQQILSGILALGLALALPLHLAKNLLQAQFKKANLSIKIHLNYFCDAINKTR
jgi:biopolymer transport protein ExbB